MGGLKEPHDMSTAVLILLGSWNLESMCQTDVHSLPVHTEILIKLRAHNRLCFNSINQPGNRQSNIDLANSKKGLG